MDVIATTPVLIDDGRKILERTIQTGARHDSYRRTIEIKDFCYAMMTGKKQEPYLDQFRPQEDPGQKNYRAQVTNSLTPFVLNQIKNIYNKVHRADNIKESIEYPDANGMKDVKDALKVFHTNNHVNNYLKDRLLFFEFFDPNAFIITERRDVRTTEGRILSLRTYPFEITSDQAINYEFENGNCRWLIVEEQTTEWTSTKQVSSQGQLHTMNTVSIFYFYTAGFYFRYYEYIENPPNGAAKPIESKFIEIDTDGDKTRKFLAELFVTGSKEFPGRKVGSYRDPESFDDSVRVPPYYPAKSVLIDLIYDKSCLDVVKRKHVYPKRMQYSVRCKHVVMTKNDDGIPESKPCIQGYLRGNPRDACPKCKGTGKISFQSEQDLMEFLLPENPEDWSKLPELKKLFAYADHDIQLPTWLAEQVEVARMRVAIAMFNTQLEEKPVAPKTATEIVLNYEEVNNVVQRYAQTYSEFYELIARITAQYLELSPEFKVDHQFPDLKLEPVDIWIQRYQQSAQAGLGEEILWRINLTIINKQFRNNPEEVEDIKAWRMHKPFIGLGENAIAQAINKRDPMDYSVILYENFAEIQFRVNLLIPDGTKFYQLPFAKREEYIEKVIEEIKAKIKYQSNGLSDPFANEIEEEVEVV